MNLVFDRRYWEEKLQYPDWYIRAENELKATVFPVVQNNPDIKAFRHKIYELVEELLEGGQIPLANSGPNFDKDRKPIDKIIVHHTTEEPSIHLSKLSAIGFIRQYGLNYLQSDVLGYKLRGGPIWSGHFNNQGKMVFFAYHWLIRPNGFAERLLKDSYIGWHSGDWKTNTRSIGIALSGDYEESSPPFSQIEGATRLIKESYNNIDKANILGHSEVKEDRTCPGQRFLDDWKGKLLKFL